VGGRNCGDKELGRVQLLPNYADDKVAILERKREKKSLVKN